MWFGMTKTDSVQNLLFLLFDSTIDYKGETPKLKNLANVRAIVKLTEETVSKNHLFPYLSVFILLFSGF